MDPVIEDDPAFFDQSTFPSYVAGGTYANGTIKKTISAFAA